MSEKRKAVRSRTLLGGMIAFNNRASTMDCQVRNMSARGAKVTFSNTAVVPDHFDLKIAHTERSFRARMIWRAPNEAGVAFLSEYN
jgi:PilZ domain-containing protein